MKKMISLFVFLVLFTAVYAKEYKCIDIVGDSISFGVNPEMGNMGYSHMLFGQTNPIKQYTIDSLWKGIKKCNSAIAGSRAEQWGSKDSPYLKTVINNKPDLVIVMIGGNDVLQKYSRDGRFSGDEKNEFKAYLECIIDTLRASNPQMDIIVINYYDLFDGMSSALPPMLSTYKLISGATKDGNEIIKKTAESKKCQFVDIYSSFMHKCYGADLGDKNHIVPDYVNRPLIGKFDIHPVTAGHNQIYVSLMNKLIELKKAK